MNSSCSHLRLPAALAALALTLTVPLARGQAFDAVRLYGAAPGEDSGFVGAVVIAGTEYTGSDQRRTLLLPLLDYQWNNGWFAGTGNGIGFNFSRRADLAYGLRLTADFGRKAHRSDALRGMGDIDAKAEFGAFFNQSLTSDIFLTSSLRYGAGDDGRGLVVDLGIGYASSLAAQWRLGVGAAVSVTNAAYQQSFFGVTTAQAASSGYPVYTPGAGLRDARANVALTYLVNRRTVVTAALSASTLLGDARDSPLVRSNATLTGVLGVSYGF
jgi:outer membrane scaffolding protein for murein synthesis (MipA/OmpV family)